MNVTNLINKRLNSDVQHFEIIRRIAWSHKKYLLTFDLQLLKAELSSDGTEIYMNFLVRNFSIKTEGQNVSDVSDFEWQFDTYDVQSDLKEMMIPKYSLFIFGINDEYSIHNNYEYLKL